LVIGTQAHAQSEAIPDVSLRDTIVVTATRVEQSSFDVPVSIEAFDKNTIQDGQPQVNLSETVGRSPGVVANTRQNYAQDLQISIRGFGARSTFGIRGVRLYTDGVPLTMPDGSGQAANVDLSSAQRVEVMRGPFSALYGNSSGGVISVFTEDGPKDFGISTSLWTGSFGTTRLGAKIGGEAGKANYILDVDRFDTDGFRDHSATTRETFNGKVRLDLSDRSHLTFIGNYLNQPDTQDPLGLTLAQMNTDREQAGNGAIAQNTRKDIRNSQTGVVFEHALSATDTIRVLGYYGTRDVTQWLALTFAGRGVVDLGRDFSGEDFRWTRQTMINNRPFTLSAGVNYDVMYEARKGFTNAAGVSGALGRDEDNKVANLDPYAQMQWSFADRWALHAGVRRSHVEFTTQDHFITPTNGDDSGSVSYSKTLPVVGIVASVSPRVNVYANVGRGFETPTFAELAYRSVSATATGFNFGLRPAETSNSELGMKAVINDKTRVTAALFRTRTQNEIVTLVNQAGRSVFQNVDRTLREGFELAYDTRFNQKLSASLSYTSLRAEFANAFLTCGTSAACTVPNLAVPNGNRIPGVPRQFLFGELLWQSHKPSGFSTALEMHKTDRIYTTDLNDEAAPAYTLFNWRASLAQQKHGGWSFNEFMRVDNLFDRTYVGSVIVNASNGQYYEPAPGRTFVIGFTAQH
ncbi:MAG TPA: TonB-dependent receptor, partial [Gammaproteobacteria bacterium]|nr:TonB-dependent receptor [Gammaproteobacteria bacterium]